MLYILIHWKFLRNVGQSPVSPERRSWKTMQEQLPVDLRMMRLIHCAGKTTKVTTSEVMARSDRDHCTQTPHTTSAHPNPLPTPFPIDCLHPNSCTRSLNPTTFSRPYNIPVATNLSNIAAEELPAHVHTSAKDVIANVSDWGTTLRSFFSTIRKPLRPTVAYPR